MIVLEVWTWCNFPYNIWLSGSSLQHLDLATLPYKVDLHSTIAYNGVFNKLALENIGLLRNVSVI